MGEHIQDEDLLRDETQDAAAQDEAQNEDFPDDDMEVQTHLICCAFGIKQQLHFMVCWKESQVLIHSH